MIFKILKTTIILFSLFTFEAKADLVEDIILKWKIDPKNNYKDQCNLMYEIERQIYENSEKNNRIFCVEKICKFSIKYYYLNEEKWHGPSWITVIFRTDPYTILGTVIDPETYYQKSESDFKKEKERAIYFVDLYSHEDFDKVSFAEKEKCNDKGCVFNKYDNDLKLAMSKSLPMVRNNQFSYIKTRGCYIDKFKIINK